MIAPRTMIKILNFQLRIFLIIVQIGKVDAVLVSKYRQFFPEKGHEVKRKRNMRSTLFGLFGILVVLYVFAHYKLQQGL